MQGPGRLIPHLCREVSTLPPALCPCLSAVQLVPPCCLRARSLSGESLHRVAGRRAACPLCVQAGVCADRVPCPGSTRWGLSAAAEHPAWSRARSPCYVEKQSVNAHGETACPVSPQTTCRGRLPTGHLCGCRRHGRQGLPGVAREAPRGLRATLGPGRAGGCARAKGPQRPPGHVLCRTSPVLLATRLSPGGASADARDVCRGPRHPEQMLWGLPDVSADGRVGE